MPGAKIESWPTNIKGFDKRLRDLEKRMNKLSRKRDGGKIDDKQFYVEYLPLQELSLELSQRRSALDPGAAYRQR